MKLLVTGGAGFIGANFVHRTLQTRPEVDIVVLDALTYAGNADTLGAVAERIEFVKGDVTDEALVDDLVRQTDAVVHFAAETHNDHALTDPGSFVRTNVLGSFALLEAVRRHGARLHQVSTDEVYGDLELGEDRRFAEGDAFNPSSPYSASKASGDLLLRAWVRSFGIEATVSHCTNNFGPWQHVEKFIPRQITNLLLGGPVKVYGDGKHVRDWIHVDDHNDAVWAILAKGEPGRTYHIGADNEQGNLAVAQLLCELVGADPERIELVVDRPGHDRRYALDAGRLTAELGWSPRKTDFRAALGETVEWYREHRDWWIGEKSGVEAQYARREQGSRG
ncbi:dTDP-glucose 4,6-dehydratase [Segniliparus rugosus]|uniref:dTDP-glucose 4,6-dehydratase n=1 Tax=Segniliparus rugosus (strain ATCC BAA-974 / DSM 45345 / CCUG 50838 / CIP 108380 / JCM 13579 / CDC 945) TaxID=679197 RepID=E5XL69_SEGRC|nr:dTDP-glucose 4,6-dehydratase [Segniliparus rugosus]EFV14937.1 dTDP-glucose 4,6-dehydratase [Segniliparus rugosus ATCC BAA-974]